MSERAPQNQDKFIVRLPDGMRDRIKDAAAANNRSMNAEIVAVLEEKYPAPEPLPPPDTFKAIYELMDFVLSGTTDAQRLIFLDQANEQLRRSTVGSLIELGLAEDPARPGYPTVFMRSLTRAKSPSDDD